MTNNEKKYLVPVEMDKEYAVKVGINPNEIKCIMLEGKLTEVYFVEVDNEEVYHQLMRPIWNSNKTYERERRCMIPNGKGSLVMCKGNCGSCNCTSNNYHSSYEEMEEQYGIGAVTESGVHKHACGNMYTSGLEEIVDDMLILEMLRECISELTEENQTIINMFCDGASENEIAESMGVRRSLVRYRKNQILKNLKNIISDFEPKQ